ncbi:hypothetical protein [Pseudomonas graminis]
MKKLSIYLLPLVLLANTPGQVNAAILNLGPGTGTLVMTDELPGWSLFRTVTDTLFGSTTPAAPPSGYVGKEQGASSCGAGGKNYTPVVRDKNGGYVSGGHWVYC